MSISYSSEQATLSVVPVQPLHRLKIVRKQEKVPLRTVAQRLNIGIQEVLYQECETTDLPLSSLYAWQNALDVPIANLLVDNEDVLVSPILERCRLLKMMKTVMSIRERARQVSIRRMALNLHNQLVEIMPELVNVDPWLDDKDIRWRSDEEVGVAAMRCFSESVFTDQLERRVA